MDGTGRPLVWLGSSRKDLRAFPREVKREMGAALYAAQHGETDPAAKPMKGFRGASVLEIVAKRREWRLARGVYGSVPRSGVRSARFPEEIEARHRHDKPGH